MKLRNKKTGETWIFNYLHPTLPNGSVILGLIDDNEEFQTYVYSSLAEFNEEWEDYKPAKPLIKDEKIRKAVRAWADANDIERVWHEYSSCWLRGNGLKIELENEVVELPQGNYSVAELCGEEEE